MRRYLRIMILFCGVAFLNPATSETVDPHVNSTGYTLGVREAGVLRLYLSDTAKNYMNDPGKKNRLNSVIEEYKASPVSIYSDYQNNQYSANKKYKDLNWFIEGEVDQVRSGIGGIPYIILKTGDRLSYESVKARLIKSEYDYLVKLKKGQNVFLSCLGAGVIMDSPEFKRCTPVTVNTIYDYLTTRFDEFLSGQKALPFSGQDYIITLIAIFDEIDEASCQILDRECFKLVNEIFAKMSKTDEDWDRWAQVLIDSGAHITLKEAN